MYYYKYPYPMNSRKIQKSSIFKRWIAVLLKVGKDFCKDTSIHGFKHIAAPRRLWIERILWICVCGVAIWGALDVSLGQLQRYNESPTVVTLEKDFRTWEFSLPAITCCYANRVDMTKLPAVIKKYWGVDLYDEKYAYYTRFVNAVSNSDLFHLQDFEEFQDMEPVDMFKIAVEVMPPVQIKTMSSEGSDLEWWPVMTESGACYVINSLAIADVAIVQPKSNKTTRIPLACKYTSLSCYIMMDINFPADFYVHSPYDVMDLSESPSTVYPTLTRTTELSIMETLCGRGVTDLKPKRRGCLNIDEPINKGRKVYTANTCRFACRSKLAKRLCGCIPFYYFYEGGPFCTPAGLWCLSKHAQVLANNNGEKCLCFPQCTNSVFEDVSIKDQKWDKGPLMYRGSVKFSVQAPRTRYIREIVFYFQDLVVSFGGAAGLFLGASFISFIEILYFLIERIFRALFKVGKNHNTVAIQRDIKKPKKILYEERRLQKLTAVLEAEKRYQY